MALTLRGPLFTSLFTHLGPDKMLDRGSIPLAGMRRAKNATNCFSVIRGRLCLFAVQGLQR